ncbi:MAG: hypothetical protein K2K89_02615 [Ruminococcus sp.]|nr:hypothetical protein [Ruminococcus sp.]
MKKSTAYFVLLVLLDIVSIVVADGSIIEIKGIIAYFIFAVPFVINIVFLWKKHRKLFNQLLISLLIFVYLVTGAIFLIRQDNRIVSQNKDGRYIYITYEINPGAMGHLSYMDNVYYSLIDTDLLTVRIVKSTKHYRYRG